MNHEPLLSIIVANYNNRDYIEECLDSILDQTFQNIEIVVSDDLSTDDSPAIIKQYMKKYPLKVTGIFNPINRGIAKNRETAIVQAKGAYITTLDSDDYYYDPHKLEKEMELVLQYKEKNRDIIAFSNIALVKGDKTLICIWGNQSNIKEGKILNPIIGRCCLIPRDFIMKKEAYFAVGGYDAQFDIYEDWDLKIRLAYHYEYYYSGVNGTAYRRHGKGLSSLPTRENIEWLERVFQKNLHLVEEDQEETVSRSFHRYIEEMNLK